MNRLYLNCFIKKLELIMLNDMKRFVYTFYHHLKYKTIKKNYNQICPMPGYRGKAETSTESALLFLECVSVWRSQTLDIIIVLKVTKLYT